VRGEKDGVNRTRRYAGEDRDAKVRAALADVPQNSDLIGGSGSSAGEGESE